MKKTKKQIKFVHEGSLAAEVGVELIESESGWSPYLSVEDACKLDDVREALRRGDVKTAARYGKIYSLMPIGG